MSFQLPKSHPGGGGLHDAKRLGLGFMDGGSRDCTSSVLHCMPASSTEVSIIYGMCSGISPGTHQERCLQYPLGIWYGLRRSGPLGATRTPRRVERRERNRKRVTSLRLPGAHSAHGAPPFIVASVNHHGSTYEEWWSLRPIQGIVMHAEMAWGAS